MKKLKQLAKEAYNNKDVCQEWKDKIEEAYPDVKTKLEIGKWYSGYSNYVIFITKIIKEAGYNKLYYYGFSYDWFDDDYIANNEIESSLRLATEEEVKEALIKEAENRYKNNGSKCIHGCENLKSLSEVRKWGYRASDNVLGYYIKGGYGVLFSNGKWAEIIQDPKEIEVEHEEVKPDIIELNGKKYKLTPID